MDENIDLTANPQATEMEVQAKALHYSGMVYRPEDVVLKLFDALQNGDYEEAVECLNPKEEEFINFWGEVFSSIRSLFSGEYQSWANYLMQEFGAAEVDVIDCYADDYTFQTTNFWTNLFAWTSNLSFVRDFLCTEADVHVRYRFEIDGEYYTQDEKFRVRRYDWAGWRIAG